MGKTNKQNMRFKISPVETKHEETFNGLTVYESAKNLLNSQRETIDVRAISKDKFRFNNGFIPETITRNSYIPEAEKKDLLKAQAEAKKRFAKEVLGNDKGEVDETNEIIWKNPDYGSYEFNNETSSLIYDTADIRYLLLYWQIMSGSYQMVSVNEDQANFTQAPYFIQTISDATSRESQEEGNKVEAIGKLYELKSKGDNDGLLYLAWYLGEKGFTKSTPSATLVKALYEFIEGKTRERNKRGAVKEFEKAYAEQKADNDTFTVKVIVKIADYHSKIYVNKEKQYVTNNGDVLGKTVEEVTDFLKKPLNREILDELDKEVRSILTNTDY